MKKELTEKARVEVMTALKKAINRPCAICGAVADEVLIFYPEGPEKFNMTERQALYFPICKPCLDSKLDQFFYRIPEGCFIGRSEK